MLPGTEHQLLLTNATDARTQKTGEKYPAKRSRIRFIMFPGSNQPLELLLQTNQYFDSYRLSISDVYKYRNILFPSFNLKRQESGFQK